MKRSRIRSRVSSGAVAAGILATAAYFILRIVVGTFEQLDFLRERWARYSEPARDWPYPTNEVVAHSVLILLEAFVLWAVLTQARGAVWRRALACAVCALVGAVAASGSFHSPPAQDYHAVWLLWIAATMLVATIVAGVAHSVQRRQTSP